MPKSLILAEVSDWTNENLLKRFRRANGIKAIEVAILLETQASRVYYLENGTTRPTHDELDTLSVLMENPRIKKDWTDWLMRRPRV